MKHNHCKIALPTYHRRDIKHATCLLPQHYCFPNRSQTINFHRSFSQLVIKLTDTFASIICTPKNNNGQTLQRTARVLNHLHDNKTHKHDARLIKQHSLIRSRSTRGRLKHRRNTSRRVLIINLVCRLYLYALSDDILIQCWHNQFEAKLNGNFTCFSAIEVETINFLIEIISHIGVDQAYPGVGWLVLVVSWLINSSIKLFLLP